MQHRCGELLIHSSFSLHFTVSRTAGSKEKIRCAFFREEAGAIDERQTSYIAQSFIYISSKNETFVGLHLVQPKSSQGI